MEYVLETNNLEKRYKDFKALSHLNIHIENGSIYGLIGKNGAGKSTTFKLVLGLIYPDSGSVHIFGKPAEALGTKDKENIGVVLADSGFNGYLANFLAPSMKAYIFSNGPFMGISQPVLTI